VEDALPSVGNVRIKSLQQGAFGDEAEGQGSGVIADASGRIVTNNRLVQCAVDVAVFLNERLKLEGRVMGTEPPRSRRGAGRSGEFRSHRAGAVGPAAVGDGVVALGFPPVSGDRP
jgi:S1-C subfamily serine protease